MAAKVTSRCSATATHYLSPSLVTVVRAVTVVTAVVTVVTVVVPAVATAVVIAVIVTVMVTAIAMVETAAVTVVVTAVATVVAIVVKAVVKVAVTAVELIVARIVVELIVATAVTMTTMNLAVESWSTVARAVKKAADRRSPSLNLKAVATLTETIHRLAVPGTNTWQDSKAFGKITSEKFESFAASKRTTNATENQSTNASIEFQSVAKF